MRIGCVAHLKVVKLVVVTWNAIGLPVRAAVASYSWQAIRLSQSDDVHRFLPNSHRNFEQRRQHFKSSRLVLNVYISVVYDVTKLCGSWCGAAGAVDLVKQPVCTNNTGLAWELSDC